MKQTLLIIGFVVLATHTYQVSAQSPLDIYWREEAISPNWSEGADPCEEIGIIASQWWYPHFGPNNSRNAPNCYGTYNLVFNNNHETVLFNNISFVEVNRITFASGATTGRTINGNGIDLRAPDLDAPRINNLSSAAHTFNVDLALHHNPVEFNPVDADLSLSGNIFTNGNYIDVYGDNGNSLFISGNISGGGGLTIKQNSTVVIEADQTYSGFTTIEDGILELKSSLASSAVTVNNETLLRINGNNVEIASLTIQSGGLVVIEPGMSLTVNGTLNNNAGNSGLVIKSDATGTGTLIHNNTGVNGTAERHIAGFTSSTSGWHFLSSPVSAPAN